MIRVQARAVGATVLNDQYERYIYYDSKDKVLKFLTGERNGNFWLYASVAVLLIGFLTAFSIYRLAANKWRHNGSHIFIRLVSIAVGALNVLLFFALTAFEMR